MPECARLDGAYRTWFSKPETQGACDWVPPLQSAVYEFVDGELVDPPGARCSQAQDACTLALWCTYAGSRGSFVVSILDDGVRFRGVVDIVGPLWGCDRVSYQLEGLRK